VLIVTQVCSVPLNKIWLDWDSLVFFRQRLPLAVGDQGRWWVGVSVIVGDRLESHIFMQLSAHKARSVFGPVSWRQRVSFQLVHEPQCGDPITMTSFESCGFPQRMVDPPSMCFLGAGRGSGGVVQKWSIEALDQLHPKLRPE
jgi:hypothetical protein